MTLLRRPANADSRYCTSRKEARQQRNNHHDHYTLAVKGIMYLRTTCGCCLARREQEGVHALIYRAESVQASTRLEGRADTFHKSFQCFHYSVSCFYTLHIDITPHGACSRDRHALSAATAPWRNPNIRLMQSPRAPLRICQGFP